MTFRTIIGSDYTSSIVYGPVLVSVQPDQVPCNLPSLNPDLVRQLHSIFRIDCNPFSFFGRNLILITFYSILYLQYYLVIVLFKITVTLSDVT